MLRVSAPGFHVFCSAFRSPVLLYTLAVLWLLPIGRPLPLQSFLLLRVLVFFTSHLDVLSRLDPLESLRVPFRDKSHAKRMPGTCCTRRHRLQRGLELQAT